MQRIISTACIAVLILAPVVWTQCADTTPVYADCFGFDETDSTQYLQKAFDANSSMIVVRNMSSPWIVSSTVYFRRDNQKIIFEPGTMVQAKKGSFTAGNEMMFRINNADNVTIIGYGATWEMRKSDYMDPNQGYVHSEGRHTLSTVGNNITILGLNLKSSGGDGIYVSSVKDFVMRDVTCDNHYRQGLTIISAVNFLAENCRFTNTFGTLPMAGVDLEPNNGNQKLQNIIFRSCVMDGNTGSAFTMTGKNLNNTADTITVLVDNCTLSNSPDTLFYAGSFREDGPQSGLVELRNSRLFNASNPFEFRYFTGTVKILINNVNVEQLKYPDGARPYPIYISATSSNYTHGNLEFNCVNITSPNNIQWLYSDAYRYSSFDNIFGNVQLHMPNETYCKPAWSSKLNRTFAESTNITLQCNGVGENACVLPPITEPSAPNNNPQANPTTTPVGQVTPNYVQSLALAYRSPHLLLLLLPVVITAHLQLSDLK